MLACVHPDFSCIFTLSQSISLWVYSQTWIRRICQRRTRTVDSHRNTTNQITHSDRQSGPKQRKTRIIVRARVQGIPLHAIELRREHDGHNNTVNRYDLAKDNRNQVLCPDTWCLYSTAQNRGAGDEDAPGGADDGETDAESNA